jgi:hypothetical protein
MDIYTHVSEQKKEETADSFADYMNKLYEEEERMVKDKKREYPMPRILSKS